MTATESAPVNTGLRSLLQTVRKTMIGSLNLSRTGGCAGLLRFSTTWKVEGADDADALQAESQIQLHYTFVLLIGAGRVRRNIGDGIARLHELVLNQIM